MVFLFCVDLCDLWACSPTCLFKRIERLVFTPTDPADFHRFFLRSVGLRRVSCSLIKASRMANSTFRIISLLHII